MDLKGKVEKRIEDFEAHIKNLTTEIISFSDRLKMLEFERNKAIGAVEGLRQLLKEHEEDEKAGDK